jgi:cytochrome c553
MRRSTGFRRVCAVTLFLFAGLAAAQLPAAGDAKRGAAHVTSCAACHGAHGEGTPAAGFPRLAGQTVDYLAAQLRNFADGSRDNGVMKMLSTSLDAQTRLDVAAYYATASAPEASAPSAPPNAKIFARGRLLVRVGDESKQLQACANCHGPDGAGERYATPYLAGQPAAYLENAIREWKTKSRSSGANLMGPVAERLDDDDIAAVAAYLSYPDQGSNPANSR